MVYAGEEAVLNTRLCEGPLYLNQCLRWARSHWQGNVSNVLKMSGECSYIWSRHPWTFYAAYAGSMFTPSLLWDIGLHHVLKRSLASILTDSHILRVLVVYWLWVFLTKNVKLWGHFCRHPRDMVYMPLLVGFSYFHGFINVWALATMTASCWGGRPAIQRGESAFFQQARLRIRRKS